MGQCTLSPSEIPPQTLAEATLESALNVTLVELLFATTMAEQLEVFHRIQDLHKQRTPAQIRRMELQRGLSK